VPVLVSVRNSAKWCKTRIGENSCGSSVRAEEFVLLRLLSGFVIGRPQVPSPSAAAVALLSAFSKMGCAYRNHFSRWW
jgi:hypothetical protein